MDPAEIKLNKMIRKKTGETYIIHLFSLSLSRTYKP